MKIKDIATYIKRGITPKYVDKDGLIVVNQKCIKDGTINHEFVKYTSKDKKFSDEKKIQVGDILINSTGTGTLGRVSYADKKLGFSYVDSHVTILRCENYNPKFLFYWLRPLEKYIESLGKGSTNQLELSSEAISGIEIPSIDISKQNKISEIISTYDDLIENNQKQIKLLEEAAQRLYKEWFVDFRFPGYEDTKFIDGIPDGWRKGVLGDLAENTGKSEKKQNRNKYNCYLPIDCLPKKSLVCIDSSDINSAESSLFAFKPYDILFGAMRPYFHKVVIAQDIGLTRSTCFILNSKEKNYWSFLATLLFAEDTINYATGISVGTTMPYVRWKDFAQMPILVPTEPVCADFNRHFMHISNKISNLAKQNNKLTQARDRLLPKLMSGEIEV